MYHQYPINPDRVKPCSHSHIMLEFNTPRRHSHRIYSSSRRADRHRQVRDQKDLRLDVGVRGSGERGVRLLDDPSPAPRPREPERPLSTTAPSGESRAVAGVGFEPT